MNIILVDMEEKWKDFLPLTFTRPISNLRLGILTIGEKWEKLFNIKVSYLTKDYLSKKFPVRQTDDNILINSCIIPDKQLAGSISSLEQGQYLMNNDVFIATRLTRKGIDVASLTPGENDTVLEYKTEYARLNYPWDILTLNDSAIDFDLELITGNKHSADLNKTNTVIGDGKLFIEEGAIINCSVINISTGPVYIGKGAEIMEGSLIRGPLALCEHARINMGAKIYGATTIGPYSKVGGEISNSVIQGYSNKSHEGFLGNSILGEWCNLGADTNTSNLKNNYAEVKMWNYRQERFIKTGLQFCGLIMGDHSKAGINTMFNTGTVVGVSSNIFGSGFPRNFIPSFSWGGTSGFSLYKLEKAHEVADKVMQRRNKQLSETDKQILDQIFDYSMQYRKI